MRITNTHHYYVAVELLIIYSSTSPCPQSAKIFVRFAYIMDEVHAHFTFSAKSKQKSCRVLNQGGMLYKEDIYKVFFFLSCAPCVYWLSCHKGSRRKRPGPLATVKFPHFMCWVRKKKKRKKEEKNSICRTQNCMTHRHRVGAQKERAGVFDDPAAPNCIVAS